MAHVVPSQVVRFIAASFEWSNERGGKRVDQDNALDIAAIVALLDEMPEEHLAVLDADEHVRLVGAIAAMRACVGAWRGFGHPGHAIPLTVLPGLGGWHPVSLVRALLEKCPDQAPTLATHELAFLGDANLQRDLRLDLSNAYHAHARRDFKSATVLAGAAIEALLYWAFGRVEAHALETAIAASDQKHLKPASAKWDLGKLLAVETQLGVLKAETHQVAGTVRDYRNLIHPEKAARLGMVCDEGTSHTALGGLLHVIRDVEAWATNQ